MNDRRSGRSRRLHIVLVGIAAAVGVAALWLLWPKPKATKPPPHQTPVIAYKVGAQDFQITSTGLGAAQAWVSDMIYAQVGGKLLSVAFTEGSPVKAGQLLATVDPRPYQATLLQAEGTLKRDRATLAGARRDLARYQSLAAEGGVSRQILEDETATVGADEGTVELDQGAVDAARINLEFCRIVSPISGRAGVRLVDPGNLVSATGSASSVVSTASAASSAAASTSTASNASSSNGPTTSGGSSGATGIVVINQIQPIAVTFTVPEGDFQRIRQTSNGFTKALQVEALSQESGAILGHGTLNVADNRVDQNTGSVELKARFDNPGAALWPGQFVNVRLALQTLPNVPVVPLAALNRGPQGQFVFVISSDHKAVIRPVTLTTTQGQTAVIHSGLRPGEIVVLDGQMTLTNGSPVRITHLDAGPAA